MKSITGPTRGRFRFGAGFHTGTALLSASLTSRRCNTQLPSNPLDRPGAKLVFPPYLFE